MGNKQQTGTAVQKDLLEQLMGSMKRYQWIITLSLYCIQIVIAWHCISHGIMVPANTPIYCNNTNKIIKDVLTTEELNDLYEEACSDKCPQVIVSNKYYDLTIVHQYKLYCNGRNRYTTLAQMIVMLGILVGNVSFGFAADNYGRKITLIIACMMQAPLGIAVTFSPNIYCFLVFKFLLNVSVGGSMVPSFVLYSEINGVKWRPIAGLLAQFPYTLGHLSLTLYAYIFRDWRYFQLAISLPSMLLVFYIWVLPESPRWLLSVGKIDRGIQQVELIARRNRLPTNKIRGYILADLEEEKNKNNQQVKEKGHFKDLFQSCRMALITVFMWINWFSIICCFYGVAQYSAGIGTNLYTSFALSAIFQQPSLWFVFYTLTFWGRRWSLLFSNSLACISLLSIYFIPIGNYQIIPTSLSMFALAMSFPSIYVYSSEIFPTTVRNLGMGSGSAMARVGAIIGAFVVDLRTIREWYPPVIFSFLMGLTLVGFIFLPETKGIVLPNTVQETEKLKSLSSQFSRTNIRESLRSIQFGTRTSRNMEQD